MVALNLVDVRGSMVVRSPGRTQFRSSAAKTTYPISRTSLSRTSFWEGRASGLTVTPSPVDSSRRSAGAGTVSLRSSRLAPALALVDAVSPLLGMRPAHCQASGTSTATRSSSSVPEIFKLPTGPGAWNVPSTCRVPPAVPAPLTVMSATNDLSAPRMTVPLVFPSLRDTLRCDFRYKLLGLS